uniref:OmpA family protein n=1 Tax=Flavobacterium sp. TaxID=239 RepID=UPI004049499B
MKNLTLLILCTLLVSCFTEPKKEESTTNYEVDTNYNQTEIQNDGYITLQDSVAAEPVYEPIEEDKYELNLSDIQKHITFESGRAILKNSSFQYLNEIISLLSTDEEKTITFNVYTDSQGNDELNKKLTDERALEIKKYLVNKGVNEYRINTNGLGESNPIDTNKTSSGRKNNRRVEIIIN